MQAIVKSVGPVLGYRLILEARGWPARAFWCEHSFSEPRRSYVASGAFALPGDHRAALTPGLARTLPYRPIWSGLAIDLAFWYVAAAPVVFAPLAIRHLRRKRLGVCRGCGYDLRGLPADGLCPECGRRGACEGVTT